MHVISGTPCTCSPDAPRAGPGATLPALDSGLIYEHCEAFSSACVRYIQAETVDQRWDLQVDYYPDIQE